MVKRKSLILTSALLTCVVGLLLIFEKEEEKALCKRFSEKEKITLLFLPARLKTNCPVCKSSREIPHLQWFHLYKIFQNNPEIKIKLLLSRAEAEKPYFKKLETVFEVLKDEEFKKLTKSQALTLICRGREEVLTVKGEIDFETYKQMVNLLNSLSSKLRSSLLQSQAQSLSQ